MTGEDPPDDDDPTIDAGAYHRQPRPPPPTSYRTIGLAGVKEARRILNETRQRTQPPDPPNP